MPSLLVIVLLCSVLPLGISAGKKPGKACIQNNQCEPGKTICQKGKCRIAKGSDCRSNEQWCKVGTICDLGKCRNISTDYKAVTNAALKKTAYSSSLLIGKASYANDGDLQQQNIKRCFHSAFNYVSYVFWRVDLGKLVKVLAVNIWNRGECCPDRLAGFYINVAKNKGDKQLSKAEYLDHEEVCLHYPDSVGDNKIIRLVCDAPVVGQYVTVYMIRHLEISVGRTDPLAPLQLCEVQIMAVPINRVLERNDRCTNKDTNIDYPTSCTGGTFCDTRVGKCKIKIGEVCMGNELLCQPDYLCDLGKCRDIKTYTSLTNVAFKKKAYGSSTEFGDPHNAVDGKTSWNYHECFHTKRFLKDSKFSFWRVDLGSQFKVIKVRIRNREDCCRERLRDITLYVAKAKGRNNLGSAAHLDDEEVCVHYPGIISEVDKTLICTTAVVGQYFTLYMPRHDDIADQPAGNAPLQLCEVYVHGMPAHVRSAGQSCSTDPGDAIVCEKGFICSDSKKKCKVPLGGDCSNAQSECDRPYLCLDSKCRIDYMGDCDEHGKDWCGTSDTLCSGKKCRLAIGGKCQSQPESCADPTVCDNLFECKKTPGSLCSVNADCVSGAACKKDPGNKNIVKCRCDINSIPDDTESKCFPKVGAVKGGCRAGNKKCDDPNAMCLGSTCICNHGTIHKNNYTCNVGAACTHNKECGPGNICAKPGETLAKCVLGYNQACGTESNQQGLNCVQGTTCDDRSITCRINLKGNCTLLMDSCVTGAVCEEGRICKGKVGTKCTSDEQCTKGAVCDEGSSKTCKRQLESNCEGGSKKDCISRAFCDEDSVCRVKVGQSCTGNTQCAHGSECNGTPKTCRIKLLHNCTNHKDKCVKGAACDVFNKCGQKTGSHCASTDVCVAGAMCANDSGTTSCRCNTAVSDDAAGGTCSPKVKHVGHSCSSAADCEDPNAECNKNKCQCKEGFAVEPSAFECKIEPGQSCDPKEDECLSSSVCSAARLCRLKAGQTCVGDFQAFCVFSTICEDGVCKVNTDENCSGDLEGLCRENTMCDATKNCKMRAGSGCSNTTLRDECIAGSVCEDYTCKCMPGVTDESSDKGCVPKKRMVGGLCIPHTGCDDPNSECVQGTCQCHQDYTIDHSFTCKKAVGKECGGPGDCAKGAECVHGTCKSDVGRLCETGDQCVPGAVCDVDGKCHVDIGQSCTSNRMGHCRSQAVCDNIETCALPVGNNCSADNDCVAGAACEKGQCWCSRDVAVSDGVQCSPLKGRVHGECDAVQPCLDSSAKCKDSVCVCSGGISVRRKDYTCKVGKVTAGPEGLTLGLVLASMFAIIGVVVGAVLLRKKMGKTERFQEEMKTRKTAAGELRSKSEVLETGKGLGTTKPSALEPEASEVSTMSEMTDMSEASTTAEATSFSEASSMAEATSMTVPTSISETAYIVK